MTYRVLWSEAALSRVAEFSDFIATRKTITVLAARHSRERSLPEEDL